MVKTPQPVIDFLSVYPGCRFITGYVASYSDTGTYIPEGSSYIYVYLNGILVNEKHDFTDVTGEVFPVGTEKPVTSIILNERYGVYVQTAPDGTWRWNIPTGYNIELGQRIVVRAQTPGKEKSEFSYTHIVHSTPPPKDILSLNSDGSNAPVKVGDQTIEGKLFGWVSSDSGEAILPYVPESTKLNVRQDLDIFNYINGINDGYVPKNQIMTSKPVLEFFSFREGGILPIFVQGEKVYFQVPNVGKNTYEEIFVVEQPNQRNFNLTKYNPDSTADIIPVVSKNGLRLAENFDYTITFSLLTLTAEQTTAIGDDIVITYQPVDNADNYVVQIYTGLTSISEFIIAPDVAGTTLADKYQNLKVFINGRKQKPPTTDISADVNNLEDFKIEAYANGTKLTIYNALEEDDILILEYVKEGAVESGYKTEAYSYYTGSSTITFDSNVSDLLYLNIFCNGIRLREDINNIGGDYSITRSSSATSIYSINVYNVLNADLITIEYIFFNQKNTAILDIINQNETFIKYRVTVRELDSKLIIESPYTLEPDYSDSSYMGILGAGTVLAPGKNEFGQFKNFFNASDGSWRYTFSRPLRKMEFINAASRATLVEVS